MYSTVLVRSHKATQTNGDVTSTDILVCGNSSRSADEYDADLDGALAEKIREFYLSQDEPKEEEENEEENSVASSGPRPYAKFCGKIWGLHSFINCGIKIWICETVN